MFTIAIVILRIVYITQFLTFISHIYTNNSSYRLNCLRTLENENIILEATQLYSCNY